MNHPLYKSVLLYLILQLTHIISFGQDDLVQAINNKLIPIRSIEVTDNFSDLEKLKDVLKDKRIIGLGEATHGTHEFFTFKHRMLEFLVKEMGFRTFAIEADFAGTFAMNDYVVNGNGTAIEALQKMTMGSLFTEEFIDMVEWMKEYNSSQNNEDKVKFYGFDMQFALNSAPALLDGTIKLTEPLSEQARQGLEVIADYRYGAIGKSQLPLLEATAKELANVTVIEEDPMKAKIYQQVIVTVIQTIGVCVPKYQYDKDTIRDRYMAENSEWLYNFTGMNKMVVWAHNLHIGENTMGNNNYSMGYYLLKRYPSEYYAMGFGFNSGAFYGYNTENKKFMISSIPEVSVKNSSDYIFGQCAVENFILDFKTAGENPLVSEFLNKKTKARNMGANYNPRKDEDGGSGLSQELIKMYDAIMFIDKTTAASPLRHNAK